MSFLIIFGIIIVLIFIANIGSNDDPQTPSTQSSNITTEPVKEGQWTPVCTLKGNGSKKSPLFYLSGGEARLKYKYKASSASIGMGVIAIYVLNEGVDLMKDGGFPEVNSDAIKEDTESSLQKSAGKYYLSVNAMGNWEVMVEEKK